MNFDPFRPAPEPRKKKQNQVPVEIPQVDTMDLEEHDADHQKLMDALWIDIGGEG